ncbi:Rne/Rng family ribonuclease [Buchnera aphidicola (Thelaxes californica)]|uniref:Rne/Rng family ribonuclease n=1 Tax=Buchnera aphidicola (Thelaxes californica) TaxID=1315998 RepID=A0A4D6YJR7_9GAMM|nr:Rne/Rng family ribonuclease [Buchnera aphidicola]QCI26801.1 Rne/Rng family ribonuclease [Buchnera aphidicola (Thelaxes californica)]
MKRMLINTIKNNVIKIAIIHDTYLHDFYIEKFNLNNIKSNIYKGTIRRIEPSLEALFIDFGKKKNGFLPFKEISDLTLRDQIKKIIKIDQIKKFISKKTEIVVQITKEKRKNKGPTLTNFITLSGIYLVLLLNNPGIIRISRKINHQNKKKIKILILLLQIPKNMGIIVRTASIGKSIKDLQIDLNNILKNWKKIIQISHNKKAPTLMYKENNILFRVFRDLLTQEIQEIIVDDPHTLKLTYENMYLLGRLGFEKKIKLYVNIIPIFSFYKLEEQINSIFLRIIQLPSGGSIVLDITEALVAIDINSARYRKGSDIQETAFHTNLEAVDEIARQLRLRDLSGIIVIDFIDMKSLKNQKIIEKRIKNVIQYDRARIEVGNISKFGLLEMSRQYLNTSNICTKNNICPSCKGFGNYIIL